MAEPVVDLLEAEWAQVTELCAGLTAEQWAQPTECPGWSVQDQVAHLVGTESFLAGHAVPAGAEEAANLPHVQNPMGASNEAWVISMRSLPPAEVLARWRAVSAERLGQLRSAPAERFDELGPSPVGQVPYREFMAVRVMDCWSHEQDIRRAVGKPGHRSGPVVEHSLARFVSAMPFVVGKKAGAPDGSTVVFALGGDAPRTITVAVAEGRAKVADEPPAAPTVRLSMDVETWWCLCLGRWDGPSVRAKGLVAVDGDTALGEKVVDGLAFMI
jgi:uncharacterized protein (TIGR03083 family)